MECSGCEHDKPRQGEFALIRHGCAGYFQLSPQTVLFLASRPQPWLSVAETSLLWTGSRAAIRDGLWNRRFLGSSVVSEGGSIASVQSGHRQGNSLFATQSPNFWSLLPCPPYRASWTTSSQQRALKEHAEPGCRAVSSSVALEDPSLRPKGPASILVTYQS